MAKFASVFATALFIGSLTFLGWHWLDRWSSQRALAAHVEGAQAYAAKVLEQVGVVPDELRESSGIAVSRTQPGVFWSHNDSGDGPTLYAIDMSGKLLARIAVSNAMARDWEEIAAGPCPMAAASAEPAQASCLFVADTGDNNQVRREVTIYVVVEPTVGGSDSSPTVAARSFNFRYPRGPTDAEAIAVRPNGDLTIVSKGRSGTIDFFGVPAADVVRALSSGETLTARASGNAGILPDQKIGRLVTAAAVSPDGATLAVRTYYEVYFYGLVNEGGQSRWRDLGRRCALGDAEPQGEAIDYLDADTLVLTSERSRGRPGAIHRLRC